MLSFHLRVVIPGGDRAPELELEVPPDASVLSRFWSAIIGSRLAPSARCVVRTGDRLVVRVKLLEADGTPISNERLGPLLGDVRRCLACLDRTSDVCRGCPTAVALAEWGGETTEGVSGGGGAAER